jgi:ATP-binding cassette subfamily B protein/subfamily B ATP-binding cassette protein MsbA
LAAKVTTLLGKQYQRLIGRFLEPFTSHQPAAQTIRRLAREQWKLLTINLSTNLLSSLSEGATLGVIFLAISLITATSAEQWRRLPVLSFLQSLPLVGGGLKLTLASSNGRMLIFAILIVGALALQILVATSSYLNSVSAGILGYRIQKAMTGQIHRRILSLSFSCASRYRVGDLLNYTQSAGPTVINYISTTSELLLNSFQFVVYLAILIAISPWLMLVAFAMAAALGLTQKQLLPRLRNRSQNLVDASVSLASRQTEQIQGLRLLHTTGQITEAGQETDDLLQQITRHGSRMVIISNIITPISTLLPIIAISLIATASVIVFQNRQSGILPSLVTFVLALQRLNIRLSSISNIFNRYASNNAQIERLNLILDDSDKQFVREGGIPFTRLQKEIELKNVALRYNPDTTPALANVNLIIPHGTTVALVGSSGAGKSSLADLLVGLYEPSEGVVLIDGIDMQTINLTSWQKRLGVVSQDTFLFNASIAENIAYGVPAASRAAIEAAARASQAAGFINALPDGYETVIGERGYRLSGGQRQRISLARAILREPELLILDEATSALDSESERLVQEAIERFERNHTVLVIAHRLSTIVNADLICVMESGQIVERGLHQELLAAGGIYSRLWQQQSADRGVQRQSASPSETSPLVP